MANTMTPNNMSYTQTFNGSGPCTTSGVFETASMSCMPGQGNFASPQFAQVPFGLFGQQQMSARFSPATSGWFAAPMAQNGSMQTALGSSDVAALSPQMANVRYIDEDTRTVIEVQTPGWSTELSEVTTVANEIRIRFPVQSAQPTTQPPMMLVLPMPVFGDGQKVQATAANDFLRIVVETHKDIASTIKKIKPTKLK